MHEPLLVPLASLALGILLSRLAGFEFSEIACILGVLTPLLALSVRFRFRTAAFVSGMTMLVFTGVLADRWHQPGPRPLIEAGPHETVLVTGCIVEPPVLLGDREQFAVELAPGARARVTVYLDEGEALPRLAYGQRIDIEGRIRRPHNFRNPGSFDYVNHLERQQSYWTMSVSSPDGVRMLPGECGSLASAVIVGIRAAALDRLDELFAGSPDVLAMFRAILFGETSRLERVWQDRFRRTGTYHTLVISGLHLAVLAACLLFVLRVLQCGHGWTLVLTSLLAWAYAGITGWHTPVIRAASGLTLYLLAGYFFRRRRLLNILAAIAVVFILAEPDQLFDPSFHLSFLAVAAIGAFAVPVLERTSQRHTAAVRGLADSDRDPHLDPRAAQFRVELRLIAETLELLVRVPRRWFLAVMDASVRVACYAFDLLVVSAVIQLALLLPMVVYFHRVSLSGLLANPILVLLTTLAVPAGFLATLTGWPLAAKLAGLLVRGSMEVVTAFSRWEPGWRVPDPPSWLAALFLGCLLGAAIVTRIAPRRRVMVGTTLAALAFVSTALLTHPFPPKLVPGVLELTAIDVGQGESLFVALPDGTRMVVDGGGIPVFRGGYQPRIDIGEDVVSPYLWSRSLKRLDVLVSTHGHEDHAGGLPALVDNFRPSELWIGAMPGGATWERLRETAKRRGVRIVPMGQGLEFVRGGVRFTVLAPPGDYRQGPEPQNNDSLVMRLSYGDRSFLLTGDIEGPIERQLLADHLVEQTDVLKLAHHGSRSSTSEALLAAARPAFAVVSAGFQNSYGFPHPDLLARLARRRVRLLRTDVDGAVTVYTDGRRLMVERADVFRPRLVRRPAFETGHW